MGIRNFSLRVFVAFLLLYGIHQAGAQSGQADVQGVVVDGQGSAIVSAQVTLTNSSSGIRRTVATGPDGRYSFPAVAPGTYEISASAQGFSAKTITGLTIQLDNHLNETIQLPVGEATQMINVSGTVPEIDTTAHDVGGIINQTQIDTLPIQNRQYLNLAVLQPGTTQAANRSFYNSVQTGSPFFYTTGFYVDGVTNQQTEEGDPRQNFPEGAVSEFKVYNASFPAELGWASGGFVTFVTKSGTNKIHGEAFEYFRNSFMNAENQFQQASEQLTHAGKPPYNRNQFGGDIGGPILRDKMQYYGAYDSTLLTQSYTMYVSGPAAADYSSLLGTFRTPTHDNLMTLRLDYELSSKQQMFVRYAQEWNLVSGNGCGPNSAGVSTTIGCYDGQIPRRSLVVGHTWEPRANLVNDARFQYAYISYELGPWNTPIPTKPTDLINPSYTKNISTAYNFPSFGWGHTYAAVGVESRWELNDSLDIEKGAHSLKMGVDASYVPYVDATASTLNGQYNFTKDQPFDPNNPATLAALDPTTISSYTANAVPLLYYLPSTQEAFYFEDIWKLGQRLTLTGGIRYERQFGSPFLDTYTPNPSKPTIPYEGNPHDRGDRNNVSPRLGFSWDPFNHGKDVVRGGYGVYYNFIQTELSEAEKLNFVACPVSLVAKSGFTVPYPDPYSGQSATNFCSTAPPNVTILSPGLSNPYQHQFSLGYSRQLANNLSISADGVYSRGLRDYKVYDRNYPMLSGVPGINGARPFSNFTQINQHASTAANEYKALLLKLEKRMSHRYQYVIGYTLSSSQDNNPHSAPVSYAAPQLDWGPGTYDQRHAVIASGSVMLPWGFVAGGILSYRSTLPFSVTTTKTSTVLPASALNANGTAQYVPGTKRNEGNRGISYEAINAYRASIGLPAVSASQVAATNYLNFDLRVSKFLWQHENMKAELIGQAFNLFGRENYNAVQTSPLVNTFGKATGASNAQIGELAARFTF